MYLRTRRPAHGFCFLLGSVSFWFTFPHAGWLLVGHVLFLYISYRVGAYHYVCWYLAGFAWTLVAGFLFGSTPMTNKSEGNLLIRGLVWDIPTSSSSGLRFRFKASAINSIQLPPRLVSIYCYENCPMLRGGERWQLVIKLRPVSGRYNPDSFDSERWYFSQNIVATGYLQSSVRNRQLSLASGLTSSRQTLKELITSSFNRADISSSLSALLVGFRGNLTSHQKELLAQSGLSHLIAISGLHVGLAMIPGVWLGSVIWIICLSWTGIERQKCQWLTGLLFAATYAALSGFGIPAQRALLMLLLGVLAKMISAATSTTHRIGFAAFLIVLVQPRAVLEVSFWLTTVVTAIIVIALTSKGQIRLGTILYLQLILAVILSAVQLLIFSNYSFLSLIQNLWAIPYISLILLPLGIIWIALRYILHTLSLPADWMTWLSECLSFLTHHFWFVLEAMQPLNDMLSIERSITGPTTIVLLMCLCLVLLFNRSRGLPLLVLLIPLVCYDNRTRRGMEISFLDVGQGTAIAILIDDQIVMYDSGYGNEEVVVLSKVFPVWALSRDLRKVNYYIESHQDVDHSGGTQWLLANHEVSAVINSDSDMTYNSRQSSRCLSGMSWQLGDADFMVISPNEDRGHSDNNGSCVVLVTYAGVRVLLTGDIERETEQYIVTAHPELRVEIMTVPHHGSRTSSSNEFIDLIRPEIVVNSSGYLNRYQFPHTQVVERYLRRGIQFYDTSRHGQIRIEISPESEINIRLSRQQNPALWRRN